MSLPPQELDRFLAKHRLPESFRRIVDNHYRALADWLFARATDKRPYLIGISGAQGTGKSTLADFLALELEYQHGWHVAVLSLDDFYFTKAQRAELARTVYPLLVTRGPPGTHDTTMLLDCLGALDDLPAGQRLRLPRFDKARDDRAEPSAWPEVVGPVDLVILEGWCVGAVAQPDAELAEPSNGLERDEDPSGVWRRYVNERLRTVYPPVFSKLEALVFLKAPSFDSVYRWRLEQETKLADRASPGTPGVMDADEIARFIELDERVTRSNLDRLAESADVVFVLDEDHACAASRYKSGDFTDP